MVFFLRALVFVFLGVGVSSAQTLSYSSRFSVNKNNIKLITTRLAAGTLRNGDSQGEQANASLESPSARIYFAQAKYNQGKNTPGLAPGIFIHNLSWNRLGNQLRTSFNDNNNAVGTIPGKLKVSSSGAAIYSIPINISPGTAGMAPKLSIQYNSQDKNGLLGMGFSLQGLTTITRDPQNISQNGKTHGVNYTNEDRFSLDGQQLVSIKGSYGADATEYRTFIDSRTKIVSSGAQGNGPASFKVWTKDGQIAEYGTTADSQFNVTGSPTVATWALNKIQDRAGNYLQIKYNSKAEQGNGDFYPTEIDYTGNDAASLSPYNKVQFVYESRPDARTFYHAGGAKTALNKRLKEIKVFQGTTLVYDYHLTYDQSPNTLRSRLTSIQLCDGNNNGFPATTFQWQSNGKGWASAPQFTPPKSVVNLSGGDHGFRLADLNGNGLVDIIQNEENTDWVGAWINNGHGWQSVQQFTPPKSIVNSENGYRGFRLVDLNGNGKLDIIQNEGDSDWQGAWLNNSNGWQSVPQYIPPKAIVNTAHGDHGSLLVDLNGNGLMDIIQNEGQSDYTGAWINNGNGWQSVPQFTPPTPIVNNQNAEQGFRLIDLNGDGLMDIIQSEDGIGKGAWLNNGNGWQSVSQYNSPTAIVNIHGQDEGVRFVDLNGDGLMDMVQNESDGNHGAWVNNGNGWQSTPSFSPPAPVVNVKGQDEGFRFVDLNGDGLLDIIQNDATSGAKGAWINNGNGWQSDPSFIPPTSVVGSQHQDAGFRLVDLNGNGLLDIIQSRDSGGSGAWLNKAKKLPDYLIGITDGLGEKTSIDYEPLSGTNVSVYTKDHNAARPNADVQTPMYVVYQTASDNPINDAITLNKLAQPGMGAAFNPPQSPYSTIPEDGRNQHITTYHYTGAKINYLGLGFLGFRQIKTTDNSTGISKTVTYSQDTKAHTQGNLIATQVQTKEGTVISSSQIDWKTMPVGNGSVNNTYYQLSVDKSVQNNNSLAGQPLSIKTMTTTTNDDGDPTEVILQVQDVKKGDTYTTDTKNTYQENSDNWILGELTDSTVTKSAPGVSNISRASYFEYDPTTGMLTKTVLEPDDPNFAFTKIFQRDSFGNIVSTTVSGQNIQARTSSVMYDPTGRFVIQKTNALGQSVYQTMDPRFGEPIQMKNLNGLATNFQYDGFSRLIKTTHPDNTIDSVDYEWSNTGGPVSEAVYSVNKTTTDSPAVTLYYDVLNRQIAASTQGFDGTLIYQKSQYDELGRLTEKSLPFYDGETELDSRMNYDVLGRLIKTTNPDGSVAQIIYDGLSTTTINPLSQHVIKIVDVRGKLVSSTDNLGNSTTYQYDAYGNLTKTTDSANNSSTIKYDKLGHKSSINDPDKGKWTYTYDSLGQLLSQTDANGATTTFKYDLLNRMIARTDTAGTSTWAYGIDPAQHNVGLLTAVNGVANIHATTPNQITRAPTTALQLIQAAKEGLQDYSRTIEYNSLSLPETDILTTNGQSYYTRTTYDKDSRPETVTYANGVTIKNEYNALGYLTTVLNEGSGQTYYQVNAMDAQGHVTSFTRSNGLITTKTYDPKTGFLTDIQTNPSQALKIQQKILGKPSRVSQVQSLHYKYDALGNVQSRNNDITNTQEQFTYDNLDRITGWQQTGASTQTRTYQYDNIGNLTDKSDIGHYIYSKLNAGPHAVTNIQDEQGKTLATFKYDVDGNQISSKWANDSKKDRTVTYTSYEKPLQIENTKATVNFFYNADRKRFERIDYDKATQTTTTTLYLSNYELVSHQSPQGRTVEMKIYGGPNAELVVRHNGQNISSHVYELLRDGLGSVTAITDENANIAQRFNYTPFGEQLRISNNSTSTFYPITHQGFTGQEEVESVGLVHMNGRIYDPMLGRFLSADSYIQDPSNSQSLNRYSYCMNNPLAFTDPTGYFSISHFIRQLKNKLGKRINQNKLLSILKKQAIILHRKKKAIKAGMSIYGRAVVLIQGNGLDASLKRGGSSFANETMYEAQNRETTELNTGNISNNDGQRPQNNLHSLPGSGMQVAEGGDFQNNFLTNTISSIHFSEQASDDYSTTANESERSSQSSIIGQTVASSGSGGYSNGAKTNAFAKMYKNIGQTIQSKLSADKELLEMAGDMTIDYAHQAFGEHGAINFESSVGLGVVGEYDLSLTNEGLMRFKGVGSGVALDANVNSSYTVGQMPIGFTSKTSFFAGHIVGGGINFGVSERGPYGSGFISTGEGIKITTILGHTNRIATWNQIHDAWSSLF